MKLLQDSEQCLIKLMKCSLNDQIYFIIYVLINMLIMILMIEDPLIYILMSLLICRNYLSLFVISLNCYYYYYGYY